MKTKTLIRYVRNKDYSPRGCVVAVFSDVSDGILIGWSLCRKGDTFNKKMARNIALGRAFAEPKVPSKVLWTPRLMISPILHMLERAKRYWSRAYRENI